MLGLGLSTHAIGRRKKAGLLIPMFAGIYRVVGAPQSWHQRLLAACLWGPGTASHRSALRLLGIDGYVGEIVEIASQAHRASTKSICFHHPSNLHADDVVQVGINSHEQSHPHAARCRFRAFQ